MKILNFTAEHQAFRKRLREFCEKEVIPFVDQWERDHRIPREIWRKMGRAGFLCTAVAPEYGGQGADFLYSVICLEEISRTNHYGLDAFLHSDIVVPYIQSYGSEEQKRRYLPGCVSGDIVTAVAMTEPDTGSDLAGMKTTVEETEGRAIINGVKTFISNGASCDLVVVAARDPLVENPYRAISLYLVEDGTPGFKKGRPFDKLGVRSQDTTELFFNDCRIPLDNRLGDNGTGFPKLMEKLQQERLLVAVLGMSKAEYVLDWTIHHCKTTRGAEGLLSKGQAVRFALAEMATEVRIGQAFLRDLIADHVDGKRVVMETSMAKYWLTELANRVADRCLDICGETGIRETCPIVRTFRDVRVTPIFAGTNEIMKNIIAKHMDL